MLNPKVYISSIQQRPSTGEIFLMSPPYQNEGDKDDEKEYGCWLLLKAIIEKLGGQVIVAQYPDGYGESENMRALRPYVRDSTFVLPNEKRVFTSDPTVDPVKYLSGREDEISDKVHEARRSRLHLPKDFQVAATEGVHFDGGNMLYDQHRDIIFMGLGEFYENDPEYKRNSAYHAAIGEHYQHAPKKLEAISGKPVVPLRLIDGSHPEKYHLDLCMNVLPRGEVLVAPEREALREEAHRKIEKAVGKEKVIFSDYETFHQFGLNLISVGNNLIMPYCSKALEETLNDKGYNIITPEKLRLPSGFFRIRDSGPHCLTQKLTPDLALFPIKNIPTVGASWTNRADYRPGGYGGVQTTI